MVTFFAPGFDVLMGKESGEWHWGKIYTPDGWGFDRFVASSEFKTRVRLFGEHLEKKGYTIKVGRIAVDGPYKEPTRLNEQGQLEIALDQNFYAVGLLCNPMMVRMNAEQAEAAVNASSRTAPTGYAHELAQFSNLSQKEQEKRAKEMIDAGPQAEKEKQAQKELQKYR